MSETAKLEKIDSKSLEGFEEVFSCTSSEPDSNTGGSISADAIEAVTDSTETEPPSTWTLKEAAKHLGISLNTVRKRIRQGELEGKKIIGLNGPEWCITPPQNTSSVEPDSKEPDSKEPVQASPASSAPSNMVISELLDELRTVRDELQSAHWRNGYLEAQLQGQKEQLKLLPDYQHRATEAEILKVKINELESQLKNAQENRWLRFWRWFTGISR